MIRVFLGLMIFLRLTFDLVPAAVGLSQAMASQSLSAFGWLAWLEWGIAAAVAWGFIVYARVGARMPESRPGLGLITFALIIMLILGAAMAVIFAGAKDMGNSIVIVVIGVLIFAGPIAVVANTLLTIGLFKLLFNLGAHDGLDSRGPASERLAPPDGGASAPLAPQDAAQPAEIPANAREQLAALVKASRGDQALQLLQACVNQDAGFKPFADQVMPLAKLAIARHESMLALRIMSQFDRLNPGHASTPSVYFLSARALLDLKDVEKAKKVLDILLERYPGDPLAPEAKRLRDGLA